MVILPIPNQEVYHNVQLLPIGNRAPIALFFLSFYIYIYIYMKLIYLNFLLEFNIQIFLFKSLSKLSYSCLAHLITQYPNRIYHL